MFRTELPLVPALQQLPLSARVLTIGSCFSDTIGARLAEAKVHALVNPFGTVFNPISACKLLRAAAGEDTDWQQHLVEARGRWQSYDLHATLGANSPVELLQTLQQVLRDTGVFLATADTVILTLGSAWAYRLKETDELVSNCHKMPAEKFDKELLTPDEIINAVAETHAYLRLRNPKLRFVLTVSPVRHLKDTLPLNAVSKSVLRVACHYLSELLPDVSYFPAYELLLDDLRDYRFYAADMLHPSSVAEEYIWERFARTYFDADFGRFRKEWEAVRQALNHRPLYEAAPEHRQFLVGTLERLEKLASRADMRMEILEVRKRLENLPQPKLVLVPEPEDDEERIDVGDETPLAILEATAPSALPIVVQAEDATEPTADNEPTNEAEVLAESMTENTQPKKKRRSRGGAKRNKKKHAARLAEEAVLTADNPDSVFITADANTDQPAEDVAAKAPEVTSAVVAFDPEAPLQTALERRKRASRRNRSRNKQNNEVPIEDTTLPVDDQQLPAAPDPTAPTDTDEPEIEAGVEPAAPDVALEIAEQDDSTEALAPTTAPAGNQRPARTGRSASEVRAAALRKPRRPDSRIKALYATPSIPENQAATPTETVPDTAEPTVDVPIPDAPTASVVPVAEAPTTPIVQPRPPVVSAIPPVRGTGASGRLSASGQATRSARNAQPLASAPDSAEASTAVPVETPASTVEAQQVADSTNSPEPENAAPSLAPAVSDEPTPAALAIDSAPKKPKAKSTSQKTKHATILAEKSAPEKAKPKAKKASDKPSEAAITEEAPASAAPAESAAAPAARRRKAAPKPATAPEPPAEKPKRAPRPSRRKPAEPDGAADAS